MQPIASLSRAPLLLPVNHCLHAAVDAGRLPTGPAVIGYPPNAATSYFPAHYFPQTTMPAADSSRLPCLSVYGVTVRMRKDIDWLVEAFSGVCLGRILQVYREAGCDAFETASILVASGQTADDQEASPTRSDGFGASTSASSSTAMNYFKVPQPFFETCDLQIYNYEPYRPWGFQPVGHMLDGDTAHNEDSYEALRSEAKKHWAAMTDYNQKAAFASSVGQDDTASYLLEKAKVCQDLAVIADAKASQNIFTAKNKNIADIFTIDLHGQHIAEGLRYLTCHLRRFAHLPFVQTLRVITGYGAHGKGLLKHAVISFLNKKGIACSEENKGCLILHIR